MKKLIPHLVPLLALVAFSAQAPARWLSVKEAGTVVEKFDIEYEVFKNGAYNQTVNFVTRIQSEDAKTSSSRMPLEYNSFTDQVEVLEAFTENNGVKIKVDPANIEDRDKGESKDYDVQKVKSVVFPQVQVGSKLHIKYRMKTSKPLIEDRWSMQLTLGPDFYVMEKVSMKVKSEMPLYFHLRDSRGLFAVKQPTPRTLEIKNKKQIPGWVHAEKDPVFHPESASELIVTTHKDWNEFFSGLGAEYEKIIGQELPKDMRAWVDKAAPKKDNPAKINFLMESLSKDFRYFGDWRRHNGGFVPRNLGEISQSRYGDCKDLSTLLAAMLRRLGMDARVALIRRGPNPWGRQPDLKMPAMFHFNHAIVYVKDGASEYWLDPTNPVMSLAAGPDISGRPAWLLGAIGIFARTPDDTPEMFEHVNNYEYRIEGADRVLIRVEAEQRKMAAFDLANDLMLSPRTEVLSAALDYYSEGQEVKSHRFLREPRTGRLLQDIKTDLEYEAGRITFNAGKAAFWLLPDGILQGAFYETENRESDLRLAETPYTFNVTRRMKNTKLAQDAPAPCVINSEWLDIERKVDGEGDDLVVRARLVLKRHFITSAEFRRSAFKSLQEQTKSCYYRSGILIEPRKALR